jgi:hypothetical protein
MATVLSLNARKSVLDESTCAIDSGRSGCTRRFTAKNQQLATKKGFVPGLEIS